MYPFDAAVVPQDQRTCAQGESLVGLYKNHRFICILAAGPYSNRLTWMSASDPAPTDVPVARVSFQPHQSAHKHAHSFYQLSMHRQTTSLSGKLPSPTFWASSEAPLHAESIILRVHMLVHQLHNAAGGVRTVGLTSAKRKSHVVEVISHHMTVCLTVGEIYFLSKDTSKSSTPSTPSSHDIRVPRPPFHTGD